MHFRFTESRTEGPMHDRAFRFFDVAWRLPCGGGCGDSFDFAELRDDTELLHKAQSVPIDKAVEHFAVRKAGNAYACDVELLPRWCDPVEIALMGTAARPTRHYCFTFSNDVLDRESNVGEGIAVKRHSLLLTLGASPNIGRRTVMVSVGRCKELVCHRYLALVPNLFEQTKDVIFVLFRHGGSPFLKARYSASHVASRA